MRTVLPSNLLDIAISMDSPRHALDARPELRKHKTMKTIENLVSTNQTSLDESVRIPRDTDAKREQFLRDYEMAASILESRNRRRDHHRSPLERTFRTAPGGRARVVLDEDGETLDFHARRSLRATSEAVPAASLSENDLSSSSREDDSGSKKKKKTVSFQDESSSPANTAKTVAMSSSSRRHLMDHARCNDDESGPGNGHTSSPIHAACFKGDHLVVGHLLSFYHSQDATKLVNSTCSCGMTPLQVACDQGHAKVAKLLLRRHARVQKRSSQHTVSSPSNPSVSHIGIAKKRHRSCLALAAARRSTEVVELLLEHGAVVDEDALVTASGLGDAAIVRALLNSHKKSGLVEKLWGSSSGSSTASDNAAGEIDMAWISSAAVVAVVNEFPGMLPVLLGDGASAASKARIVYCAIEATNLADYKLLRCLTKLFDHKLLMEAKDAHQNTLLHLAVKQASARCVTLLIRLGVEVNARDALSITPLYMACARGQSSIVKLLLNAGASCEAMGPNDETPLHIAAQENHLSCVTLLLTEGNVPVDGTTLDKCTALHLACQRGNTTVAKCLLDHGADVNARTVCDETPLLKASRMSNLETVKLLLSRNAELATSSTSSISSCASSLHTRTQTGDYTHTASTSSSVFSTGSTVRSLDETDRSGSGTGSSSGRRRHPPSEALLQRVAARQTARHAEEKSEEVNDQIFMAKSNSHKSFRGWLKSVVSHK